MCYFIIDRQLSIEYVRVVALFVLQKLGLKKIPNVVQRSVVLGTHLWPLSVQNMTAHLRSDGSCL